MAFADSGLPTYLRLPQNMKYSMKYSMELKFAIASLNLMLLSSVL